MALFENFPYTNLHNLNLDWIVKMIKTLDEKFDEAIEGRITIADPPEWDITKQYPPLTIVFDDNKAYLSLKAVPEGIALSNEEYWANIFDVDTLFEMITDETAAREAADTALGTRITDETTARTSADTALGTRITNETTARSNADTALGQRITDETTARTNADTALGQRITDETNARTNADTALGNRITALDAATAKNNSAKHLLFCGDSYTDWYSGRLFNKFVAAVGIPAAQCHNLAVSGAAFTPGLAAQFITQVQGYAGNRSEITDILVAGGINDALIDYGSYTTSYPDTSATYNAMSAFYNYCRQEYPNAKIHIAYIGGCLVTSQYYTSLHPARAQDIALFLYTVGARDIGFNVLSCFQTIHLTQDYYSSDGLHPSEAGVDAIATSLANVFNGGYNVVSRPFITVYPNAHETMGSANLTAYVSIIDDIVSFLIRDGYATCGSTTKTFNTSNWSPIAQLSGGNLPMIKHSMKIPTTVLLNGFTSAIDTNTVYKPVPAELVVWDGKIGLNVFEINPNTGSFLNFQSTPGATITIMGATFTTDITNIN